MRDCVCEGVCVGKRCHFNYLYFLQYTVVPSRRATASSIQILFSHMLGDAVSPTIVGVVRH